MVKLKKGGHIMKSLKIVGKVFLCMIALLIATVILWGTVMFWYYPYYRNNKTEVAIREIYSENEVRVMSYNLRCLNPLDVCKKKLVLPCKLNCKIN